MKLQEADSKYGGYYFGLLFIFLVAGMIFGKVHASVSVGFDPDHTPPVHSIFTKGSIDAKTGKFKYESLDLSVGSGAFPARLDLIRTHLDAEVRFNLEVRAVCVGCKPYTGNSGQHPLNFNPQFWGAVHIILPGKTYAFHKTSANGEYQNSSRDGGALVSISNNRLEFTSRDGIKAFFDFSERYVCGYETPEADRVSSWRQASCLVARQLQMPDGQGLAFEYDTAHDGYYTSYNLARLRSVTNTSGYGINFSYNLPQNRSLITNASAFRVGCVTSDAVTCNQGSLPSVSYEWTNFPQMLVRPRYRMTAYINPEGRKSTYQYSVSGRRLESARYPDKPSLNVFTNHYLNDGTISHQEDGEGYTTYYTYQSNQTIIQGPSGEIIKHGFSGNKPVPDWIENSNGGRTVFTYDQYYRVTRIERPGGRAILEYDYDNRGNITEQREVPAVDESYSARVTISSFPACNATNYRICNKPSYSIDYDGARTDYAYHTEGGGLSGILYPPNGNGERALIRVTYSTFYPASGVAVDDDPEFPDLSFSTIYLPTKMEECMSSAVSVTAVCPGGNNITTNFSYTPSSQSSRSSFDLESITMDAGGLDIITRYKYNRVGDLVQEKKPFLNGSTIAYAYNGLRQILSSRETGVDGSIRETQVQYDLVGRLTRISRRLGSIFLHEIQFSNFDNRGLPKTEIGASGEQTTYSYDQSGRISEISQQVDGRYRKTYQFYDTEGQLIRVERTLNGRIVDFMSAIYSDSGDLIEQKDAKGNITRFCYDSFGQLVERRFSAPAGGAAPTCTALPPGGELPENITRESFAYDANGNVTKAVLRNGYTFNLSYDSRGNLIEENVAGIDRDVRYTYDILGRMIAAELPGENEDLSVYWTFDSIGRVLSEQGAYGHTIQREYGALGDQETLHWPGDFSAYYNHDGLQRIKSITTGDGNQIIAAYSHDALSRATQVSYGNGTQTSFDYNGGSRLHALSHDMLAHDQGVDYSYQYNEAGQILNRSSSNSIYAWRPYGPVRQTYRPSSESFSVGANALNQYGYIENQGQASHSLYYDASGNLTSCVALEDECGFIYEGAGRLVSADGIDLTYDALGRLVQVESAETIRQFLYDGVKLIGEYENGLWRRTIHAPNGDTPLWMQDGDTQVWLHADERGSVIAGTDELGALSFVNSYGPFGEHGQMHTGRFGFTGQVWLKEIGLYYFKARFYSAEMGRFLQPDPLGEAAGPNLYAYADNDPINLVDSFGLSPHVPGVPARLPTIVITPHDRGPQWSAAMMPTINPRIPSAEITGRTWSSYLPGTRAGHNAAQYWADMATSSNHPLAPLAHVPGVFASLWTDETAAQTVFALGSIGTGSVLKGMMGPARQWIRIGPSYSKAAGQHMSLSIRWGASPVRDGMYIRQIPSASMQRLNQWLRQQRLPGNGWRTQDSGHLHIKR